MYYFLFLSFFIFGNSLLSSESLSTTNQSALFADIQKNFLFIDGLISSESSHYASLRPAWDAVAHIAAAETTSTEQLLCAIAILRKALTVLRRTEQDSTLAIIDDWCESLTSYLNSGASVHELQWVTRSCEHAVTPCYHKKKKRKLNVPLFVGSCAAALGVGVLLYRMSSGQQASSQRVIVQAVENRHPYPSVSGSLPPFGHTSSPESVMAAAHAALLQDEAERRARNTPDPGCEWVRLLPLEHRNFMQSRYPELTIVRVEERLHRMMVRELTPRMRSLLQLADSLVFMIDDFPTFQRKFQRDERFLDQQRALAVPINIEEKQQKVRELLNDDSALERYVVHAFSGPQFLEHFITFCSEILSRNHVSNVATVQLVSDFAKILVTQYWSEIHQLIINTSSGCESFRLQYVRPADTGEWDTHQYREKLPSLMEVAELLPAGEERNRLFECIINFATADLSRVMSFPVEANEVVQHILRVRMACMQRLWLNRRIQKTLRNVYRALVRLRSDNLSNVAELHTQ